MVQESRELAGRIEEETPQYKTGANLLADFAASLGKQGLLPKRLPKQPEVLFQESIQTQELDLDAEWQRQASEYVRFGFHKEPEINLSEQEYLDSLPKFSPQSEEYKGRFSLPLLVETRIPWNKQAQLAGIAISDYLLSRVNQTKPDDARSQTPDKPYAGWFNNWDERFTQPIRPTDARRQLAADEISCGPHEGIAIQVANPQITGSGKHFDLIGYRVESGLGPYLSDWVGRPRLNAHWSDDANVSFRPLVRGSKIVTK